MHSFKELERPPRVQTDARRSRREGPATPSRKALEGVTGFRLRRLQGFFVAHWARWFRQRGLSVTPVQGGILLLIQENAGLTQIELARLLQVEAPTLMQTLNPLISAGLVERLRSKRDRRAVELRLSRTGEEAASIVSVDIALHESDLLSHLTAAERTELLRLLEKALASAESALSQSR